MNGVLAYILLYISAAFYCGFNTAIKKEAARHLNDTTIQALFPLDSNNFDLDCEVLGCLTKTLKLYDDEGFVIEDGWLTIIEIFSSYDTASFDTAKKNLGKCVPDVNRKLVNYSKCKRYRAGFELLNVCADMKLVKYKINGNL